MVYQGYQAQIEYDPVDRVFVGHIIAIRDIVGFHGENVELVEAAFRDAVEHYIVVSDKLDKITRGLQR